LSFIYLILFWVIGTSLGIAAIVSLPMFSSPPDESPQPIREPEQTRAAAKSQEGATQAAYPYLIFRARRGASGQPLLLFLHGSGESGTDLELVKRNGPPKLFPRFGLDRFSVVAPQCPDERLGWDPTRLATFLAEIIEQTRADARRIYVTGLSMGGTGALDLAAEVPDRIAAATILCGEGDPAKAPRLDRLPVWLFHSAADGAVPVTYGDRLFDALRDRNATVTYTRYRDADHGQTWERAYESPFMYDWLLSHARQ
jgi:predicted peptidase